MAACTCAACLREFTSVSAFDLHQTAGDGSFGSVTCHEPAARGLVRNERGRWHFPVDAAARLSLERMRAGRSQSGISVTPEVSGASGAVSGPQAATGQGT